MAYLGSCREESNKAEAGKVTVYLNGIDSDNFTVYLQSRK